MSMPEKSKKNQTVDAGKRERVVGMRTVIIGKTRIAVNGESSYLYTLAIPDMKCPKCGSRQGNVVDLNIARVEQLDQHRPAVVGCVSGTPGPPLGYVLNIDRICGMIEKQKNKNDQL
jgi:hypothetical protein